VNAEVIGGDDRLHGVPNPGDDLDALYAADLWRARELGVAAPRGRTVGFARINPPWLRNAAKQWGRQRLALGCAFATLGAGVLAIKRFAEFMASCRPPVCRPDEIDRALVERYLAWLVPLALADSTKESSRVYLRAFLDENRRYHWVEAIAADAVVYDDELLCRRRHRPRFIPEFVMSQLESDANLARLKPHYRHLVAVLTETGLRSGDAFSLPFDPLITDSTGWPCLRFESWKMRTEQLVPLSERAVVAVRDQQRHVVEKWPQGSRWLFPSNADPRHPQSTEAFRAVFGAWQKQISLHDEAGQPTRVTPHQLRHTLGTRLINQNVPQHVIQRLLGHATPEMTAVYARLHDSTVRKEFERYCQTRVDIQGQLLGYDPEAPTADAEWIKHNLARAADTLPNGYCGRPPQQDCPHPNACLTCPDFQTTVQFLPVHRRQAEATRELIDAASASGYERLATNHRRVLANLERIIPALETLEANEADGV